MKEKNLAGKAYAISNLLGKKTRNEHGHGIPKFDDGVITIEGYQSGPPYTGRVTVWHLGVVVFEQITDWEFGPEIKAYIPGEWEVLLDKYYPEAIVIAQQRQRTESDAQRVRDEEEKKKWGL